MTQSLWIVISTTLLLFCFLNVYRLAKKQGYKKGYREGFNQGADFVLQEWKKDVYGDENGFV